VDPEKVKQINLNILRDEWLRVTGHLLKFGHRRFSEHNYSFLMDRRYEMRDKLLQH